jgi:hypothetical protein
MGMAALHLLALRPAVLLSIHTDDSGAARPSPAGPVRSRRSARGRSFLSSATCWAPPSSTSRERPWALSTNSATGALAKPAQAPKLRVLPLHWGPGRQEEAPSSKTASTAVRWMQGTEQRQAESLFGPHRSRISRAQGRRCTELHMYRSKSVFTWHA